jgi:tetratricopeptide (TPR) repeat protein
VVLLVTLLGIGGAAAAVVFSRQAEEQRLLAEEARRAEAKADTERRRAVEEATKAASEAERANHEAATASQVTNFLVGLFEPKERFVVGATPLGFMSWDKDSLRASDLLSRGVERLNTSAELKGQPLVRARLLHQIGMLSFMLGEVEKAAPLLEEALRLRRAHLPADHPDLAVSLRALGLLRYVQGDESALDLHRQAVAILKKQPGPDSLELAEAESGLAICLVTTLPAHQRAEGFALLNHALEIRRRRLGKSDPQTITNLWMLAWIYLDEEEYLKGLAALAEVQAGLESGNADRDLVTVVRLATRALQMRLLQGQKAALPYWREVLEFVRKRIGDRHYLTVKAKRVYAGWVLDAYPESDPALEEAVKLFEECLQSTVLPKWEQGLNRLDLARALFRLRRYRECEENLRLALPLLRQGGALSVGEIPHVLQLRAILAEGSGDPRRRAEVEGLLKEAVEISRAKANVPNFRKAHSFMDLGRYRLLRGDAVTSAALFAEAAAARVRGLGRTNFEVGEALAYQSAALKLQGKTEEATRLRAQAEEILRPHRSNQHPAAVRARLVLAGKMPPWP